MEERDDKLLTHFYSRAAQSKGKVKGVAQVVSYSRPEQTMHDQDFLDHTDATKFIYIGTSVDTFNKEHMLRKRNAALMRDRA